MNMSFEEEAAGLVVSGNIMLADFLLYVRTANRFWRCTNRYALMNTTKTFNNSSKVVWVLTVPSPFECEPPLAVAAAVEPPCEAQLRSSISMVIIRKLGGSATVALAEDAIKSTLMESHTVGALYIMRARHLFDF